MASIPEGHPMYGTVGRVGELKVTQTEASRADVKASITIPVNSEITEGYVF